MKQEGHLRPSYPGTSSDPPLNPPSHTAAMSPSIKCTQLTVTSHMHMILKNKRLAYFLQTYIYRFISTLLILVNLGEQ